MTGAILSIILIITALIMATTVVVLCVTITIVLLKGKVVQDGKTVYTGPFYKEPEDD